MKILIFLIIFTTNIVFGQVYSYTNINNTIQEYMPSYKNYDGYYYYIDQDKKMPCLYDMITTRSISIVRRRLLTDNNSIKICNIDSLMQAIAILEISSTLLCTTDNIIIYSNTSFIKYNRPDNISIEYNYYCNNNIQSKKVYINTNRNSLMANVIRAINILKHYSEQEKIKFQKMIIQNNQYTNDSTNYSNTWKCALDTGIFYSSNKEFIMHISKNNQEYCFNISTNKGKTFFKAKYEYISTNLNEHVLKLINITNPVEKYLFIYDPKNNILKFRSTILYH